MGWAMLARPVRRGFTLLELLVVIGIIVLLMGIILTFFSSVRKSQKRYDTMSNMRLIGNALRQYQLDERGFPPFDPSLAVAAYNRQVYGTPWPPPPPGGYWTGLWALVQTGTLGKVSALHDPGALRYAVWDGATVREAMSPAKRAPLEDAFNYCTYQTFDPETGYWMYQPWRGDQGSLGLDYRRQLWPYPDGSGQSRWMPADSTVVLWSRSYRGGSDGVTLVMYLDGSVHMKRSFLTDPAPPFIPMQAP